MLKPSRKSKRYRFIEALKTRNIDYNTNMVLDAKLRDYIKGNVSPLKQGMFAPSKWAAKNEGLRVQSLESDGRNNHLRRGSGGTTVSDPRSQNITTLTKSR